MFELATIAPIAGSSPENHAIWPDS